MDPAPLYVGGEWKKTGKESTNASPFDGPLLGAFSLAGTEEAEEAVRRGLEGYGETKELSSFDKAEILFRIADGIQSRRDGLAECITSEVGKSIQFSRRSEEHTSELQSRLHLVCRLLLEKKKKKNKFCCTNFAISQRKRCIPCCRDR